MPYTQGTPEEALRLSVDALGGMQKVGHGFKSEYEPALAGQWLAHCLTASMRDKLSLAQMVKILRDAHDAGQHNGFQLFARLCGYSAEPLVSEAMIAELQSRQATLEREASELKRDLAAIGELSPETLERMRRANLKVGP